MKRLFFLIRLAARWLARPPRSMVATPALFGALVLTGCGGGALPAPALTTPAPQAASAVPMKATPTVDASSGEIAYFESLQDDRRAGKEVSRDQ